MTTKPPPLPFSTPRATKLVATKNTPPLKKAAELERRYHAAESRLSDYDAMRKADRDAGQRFEQTERQTLSRKQNEPPQAACQPPMSDSKAHGVRGKRNKHKGQVELAPAASLVIPHQAEYFEDGGLPLTRKQRNMLNRLFSGLLTPAERLKLKIAFDQNRYLQALLQKRVEAKRVRRQVEMKKNRAKRSKTWVSQPSQGSSLFGGIKYSHVRVFQGGLPGQGKSK